MHIGTGHSRQYCQIDEQTMSRYICLARGLGPPVHISECAGRQGSPARPRTHICGQQEPGMGLIHQTPLYIWAVIPIGSNTNVSGVNIEELYNKITVRISSIC